MVSILPKRGQPRVEFIEDNLARWTFTSTDRSIQEAEFDYWRGWFGFEEQDKPHEMGGTCGSFASGLEAAHRDPVCLPALLTL